MLNNKKGRTAFQLGFPSPGLSLQLDPTRLVLFEKGFKPQHTHILTSSKTPSLSIAYLLPLDAQIEATKNRHDRSVRTLSNLSVVRSLRDMK